MQQDYDSRGVKNTWHRELLSQTPLEAIRFLDILGITATLESTKSSNKLSPEDTKTKSPSSPQRSRHCSTSDTSPLPDVVKDLPPGHLNGRKSPARDIEHPEWFHQRLLLFESLCNKHNSSSFSSNNSQSTGNTLLVTPSNLSAKHRAISCHNLSQNNTQPVKDICKYFEEKNQLLAPPGPTIQDYIPTPPREHEVAKRRFSHLDHSFTPLVRLTKHIS
ncbi:uncharacterized protein LOC108254329 [Diaphorina citri]|uniref:Uncharacterized protein LOC108254329 n=1 Tax=Diaphorina citri TaxID=121845 RepID=A0A1S4ERL1_DIACI|nr:uncharacterized protein LOC108254329 [Diaphorina citri]